MKIGSKWLVLGLSAIITGSYAILVLLDSPVRVVDQPWRGLTAPVSHLQGIQDKLDSHVLVHGPTDNLTGIEIQDYGKI